MYAVSFILHQYVLFPISKGVNPCSNMGGIILGRYNTSRMRDVLRGALRRAFLGGFGGTNFFKWCNLVRFGVYLDQILSLKKLKNYYFLYKFFINYHFFYKNFKNDYFQVKIHVNYSCMYMLGGSGAYASSLRKFRKFCAVWCILVYILIRLCLEKFPRN